MTEVVLHSPYHFASSRRRASSSSASSASSTDTVTSPIPPDDGSLLIDMHSQTPTSYSSSSPSVDGDGDVTVIECEGEEVGKDRFKQRRDQLSLLALVVTLFRKSLIACKSDRRELCAMEIGWPTNVRHVTHVTFDRFNGFLGLPVEFEPEVPRRAPSASTTVFGVSTESMQLSYDSRGNSVPTILILMQHCLYAQGGLQAEGIFRINAENSQEEYVRDQLNQGVVPDDIDVHCLAGLIKAWFRELPAGILDSLSSEQVMQCRLGDRAFLMESSSSSFSSFEYSLSRWDYLNLFILRPILAILFTFSLISLGWFLAWKLVLVHVPLVQEIFGLRKKPVRPKPPTRRLSRFYSNLNSQTSASSW